MTDPEKGKYTQYSTADYHLRTVRTTEIPSSLR